MQNFPYHTNDETLSQFLTLNFAKSVPESFLAYQAAMRSDTTAADQDSNVFIVKHNCLIVSHSTIKDSGIPFSGYKLFFATIPEVCTYTLNLCVTS